MSHNRLFACVLLCLVSLQGADAQSRFFKDDPHVFYGGLVLGMNMSQVDGDSYAGYHKAGFNVGGCVYAQFSPALGISMELLYAQKGSRAVTETNSPYVGTYFEGYYLDLNYVEIPVMFNFFTNHRIHASLGASYSRLIKAKENLTTDQGFYIDPNIYYFNKSEFSYIAGLSYQLYKGLFINARYQYSISPVRPYDRAIVGERNEFNNVINFRLIYLVGSANNN